MRDVQPGLQFTPEKLAESLELYSNAIVAFLIVQSIAFVYALGINDNFNRHILCARYVATGVIAHFVVCGLLGSVAVFLIRRAYRNPVANHKRTLTIVCAGKVTGIVLFVALPVFMLSYYGFWHPAEPSRCAIPPGQSGST